MLERKHAEVLGLVLAGNSDAQVAVAISTKRDRPTRQAVTAFRRRNDDEIAEARARADAKSVDLWITDDYERNSHRQALYEETDEKRRALPERAGMTYAAMVREERSILDAMEPKGAINIDARRQSINTGPTVAIDTTGELRDFIRALLESGLLNDNRA